MIAYHVFQTDEQHSSKRRTKTTNDYKRRLWSLAFKQRFIRGVPTTDVMRFSNRSLLSMIIPRSVVSEVSDSWTPSIVYEWQTFAVDFTSQSICSIVHLWTDTSNCHVSDQLFTIFKSSCNKCSLTPLSIELHILSHH